MNCQGQMKCKRAAQKSWRKSKFLSPNTWKLQILNSKGRFAKRYKHLIAKNPYSKAFRTLKIQKDLTFTRRNFTRLWPGQGRYGDTGWGSQNSPPLWKSWVSSRPSASIRFFITEWKKTQSHICLFSSHPRARQSQQLVAIIWIYNPISSCKENVLVTKSIHPWAPKGSRASQAHEKFPVFSSRATQFWVLFQVMLQHSQAVCARSLGNCCHWSAGRIGQRELVCKRSCSESADSAVMREHPTSATWRGKAPTWATLYNTYHK